MTLRTRTESEEVLMADGPLVDIGSDDVLALEQASKATARQRVRVCAHQGVDDPLHEMVIVHATGTYVRPHKHLGKSESMHVIKGEADLVLFDDDGNVTEVVPLGPYGSDRRFYFRSDAPIFHTLLIRSETFVFHESTSGPFRREDTVFAPWAPEDVGGAPRDEFMRRLEASIAAAGGA